MSHWTTVLRDVEAKLASERGSFALFAAFLPEDSADQWDLVVSAPWARRDDRAILDLLTDRLSESLATWERLLLARIVVVETWHGDVQKINKRVQLEHGLLEVSNEEHFGYVAERGYIITSQDRWRFMKDLFPHDADFVFFSKDGDLFIRISWPLPEPDRPFKRSKNIMLEISEEALDGYLNVGDPLRNEAERRLAAIVSARLRGFDPQNTLSPHATPPREYWRVSPADLRRRAALG